MIDYIINNPEQIVQILLAIIGLASVIAAVTPNPKDDGIVRRIRKVVNLLAANVGNAKNKDE